MSDPEWKAFEADARKNLVPMLKGSAVYMAINPGDDVDIKFAVELGLAIMLDKPLIVVSSADRKVPAKLRAIADEIIEVDFDDLAASSEAMAAAFTRLVDTP